MAALALWPLLQAAVLSAEKATVFLDDPSDAARDLDETWVGAWEEAFGEAKPVSLPMNQITDSLFSEAEMRSASQGPLDRSFLVGADTTEQAEVVAQNACIFSQTQPVIASVSFCPVRAPWPA